ncbi:hypothetical protein HOY82DRAFT_534760 [Tuber indicum]|nr:hypothetical protein HOY82DRAFT_534760 [Tuber indicum]
MVQKRKLRNKRGSGGGGLRTGSKRRRSSVSNGSSSTWITVSSAEGDKEAGSSFESTSESSSDSSSGSGGWAVSPAVPKPRKRGCGVNRSLVEYSKKSETPRHTNVDESFHPSPSKKPKQTDLETDGSVSEFPSGEDSEEPYDYFDPPVKPRKIYLAPDRYAEHIAKVEREERLKRYNEHAKKRKPWELRTLSERGPRAGRSDEFATEEEAQYAENIIRTARRHRLETWHRERHEMWGLKEIQSPDMAHEEMEDLEEEEDAERLGEEDLQTEDKLGSGLGASDLELGAVPTETLVRQEDVKEDATIEEILQGIPGPLDPCFESPADVIFLPRNPRLTQLIFSLEYSLGYNRRQIRWLMGGARPGRGCVPSANTIAMRLTRYMRKNDLMDAFKVPPPRAAKESKANGESTANYDSDEEEEGYHGGAEKAPPLLPHGPRIPRPELGVHGWVWDHPHEEKERLEDNN